MVILGIDPGFGITGYGLIEVEPQNIQKASLIEAGVIEVKERETAMKLKEVSRRFAELLARLSPDRIGIEKIFFSKNAKTAIEVTEARGLLLHISAERVGIENIFECTPQQVKVAVTNYGGADKKAVARMAALILKEPPFRLLDDATDAIAIAIATAHGMNT